MSKGREGDWQDGELAGNSSPPLFGKGRGIGC